MIYKSIPNTDLSLSVIALGTWVFGDDVWGNAPEEDCIKTVDAALEHGINLIDTAPIYGHGRSEEVVGKAIKEKRDKVILATKCGLKLVSGEIKTDLSADSIREEIEGSLKRLQVEYIDIYQCHWPDSNTAINETINALLKLKREGKIRYIGLSNYKKDQLKEALDCADIAVVQNHYSLLERSLEKELLGFCLNRRIGVITYGSLGGGILSGKYNMQHKFDASDARSFFYKFYDESNFKKTEILIGILREIAQRIDRPVSQVAINWIWQKEGITGAIVGARNAEQAISNALSTEWELSQEDITKLNNAEVKIS
ncbi:MAG: aldo/keto reductase [Candidatus Omnitrophota bacterium]